MGIIKITIKNILNMNFDNLWVERYRPSSLEDIVLSSEDKVYFNSIREKQEIPHLLFAGVQGTGKTSLAKILVNSVLDCQYLYINASDENGIDAVRGKIVGFAKTKAIDGKLKVVLLDEADNISLDGQKALRNVMEEFANNTRFILTCNYLFKVIPPLQSRCQIINLIPPVDGVVEKIVHILKKENVSIPPEQKVLLLHHVKKFLPDLRRIINDVQMFSNTGVLQIRNEVSKGFAETIYKQICQKEKLTNIRKYIIENEKDFSNDYRQLQKELFEVVFSSNLSEERKSNCLLIIAKGLEADAFVVDKEINAFATIINLFHNISLES